MESKHRGLTAFGAILVGMLLAVAGTASAQQPAGVNCPSTESQEHRLLMQQWAVDGNCRRPTVTRVLDKYLGFTCVEQTPGEATCRAFMPGPASAAFDTSKHFRCIDVDLTVSEGGVVVSQLREWAAPKPRQCDYSDVDILTAEVNFASAQVCVGALCMPIERLSTLGKFRLRRTIERAFRDLGLMSEGDGAQASFKTGRLLLPVPAR
jgi:hypothetical protein